jgi:F-type H+-transporting ATPase subunit a
MTHLFAAGDGIHISLKAEPLFQLGPLTVTNAIVYGLMGAVFIAWLMIWAARSIRLRPSSNPLISIIEIAVEYVINLLSGPFGTRKKAAEFAPIFGVFFIFIMVNNLLGIIPLVGPAFALGETPLFRPFTADLNGTIAMSLIAIIFVQILSIQKQGAKKHLQHYFTDKPLNPINFFIGILEVFGEITRVISLSLRLFLNTAVGEILIAVFTSMILINGRTPVAVIPILLFEVLVAYIQAYVFTVLTGTYLGMALHHSDHDEEHDTAAHQTSGALEDTIRHHSPAHLTNQVAGIDGS